MKWRKLVLSPIRQTKVFVISAIAIRIFYSKREPVKKRFDVIAVLVVGLLLFLFFPTKGMPQTDGTNPTASESMEYMIEDIQGNVQVLEAGAKDWEVAEEGQSLESGDEVKVGDNSEATLMLQSETSIHLNAGTDMKVDQIEANPTGGFLSRLEVMAGGILADVKKHLEESHSTFEVESSGVICGVRGTAFEVTTQDGTAQVATHEGSVEVGNGTESHVVDAGNFSEFQNGKFRFLRKLDRRETERFQKWRVFRKLVLKKRLQRLEDIRNHRRAAWVRKHARLGRAILRHKIQKRKKRLEER